VREGEDRRNEGRGDVNALQGGCGSGCRLGFRERDDMVGAVMRLRRGRERGPVGKPMVVRRWSIGVMQDEAEPAVMPTHG
jgi:hypothetical protein